MILMKTNKSFLLLASLALAATTVHAAATDEFLNEKPTVLPAREVRVDRLDQVQKDVRTQLNQLRDVAHQPVKVQVELEALKLSQKSTPSTPAPTVPAPVVIAGV